MRGADRGLEPDVQALRREQALVQGDEEAGRVGRGHHRDVQVGLLDVGPGSPAGTSRQEQDGFSFDVEDLVIAKKLGLRAVEVPVRWANVEGTKVTLAQGLRSFTDLLQIRKDHT